MKNIISDWLEKHGDPKITEQVKKEAELLNKQQEMDKEKKIESIREQMAIMASMTDGIEHGPAEVCGYLHTEIENLSIRFIELFGEGTPRLRYAAHLSMIVKYLCLTGEEGAEKITERYKIQK